MHKKILSVAILAALHSALATAGPADYVYTPIVEYGESELDFKFGTAEQPDGESKTVSTLGYGVGATENWFSEIYLKQESEGSNDLTLLEWENKFQLTETGKYPVDLGIIVEIESPLTERDVEPNEFKFGPLLQAESERMVYNLNLLFERKFGNGAASTVEMGYQLQARYRLKPELEIGAQVFGEMGEWNHWEDANNQKHRAGPAVFGKFNVGAHDKIKYNAALLTGLSDATPDSTFRLQAEYEF